MIHSNGVYSINTSTIEGKIKYLNYKHNRGLVSTQTYKHELCQLIELQTKKTEEKTEEKKLLLA
jgi:hypothetical protein